MKRARKKFSARELAAPAITIVINTKNEEENIGPCIRSAKLLSDDILVADMHSADGTVEKVRALGARVMNVKDYDYVEPARNAALKKAKGDWILILDADERLRPALVKALRQHIARHAEPIVELPRKNIILKRWMRHTAWWPDYQVRFFKRGSVTWKNTIHSVPTLRGNVRRLPAREEYALVHHNLGSIHIVIERILRYAGKEPVETIGKLRTVSDIRHMADHEFAWRYLEKEGYKDGIHGYVMSECIRFYRLLIFMKHWEKAGYPHMTGARAFADEMRGESVDARKHASIIHHMRSFAKPHLARLQKHLRGTGE